MRSTTASPSRNPERADVAIVPGVDFDPSTSPGQAAGSAQDRGGGYRAVRLSYAAGESAVAEALERIIRFQG